MVEQLNAVADEAVARGSWFEVNGIFMFVLVFPMVLRGFVGMLLTLIF